MRSLNSSAHPDRLAAAASAIDEANRLDPTVIVVRGETMPLALAHGRLAAQWVERLAPSADDALRLAARAHHLRRWEVARTSYPDGRPGYLRWRRDQKARHAADVAAIMDAAGYDHTDIDRAQRLIRRELLGTDADTQVVEDAACLVFIETQLSTFAERLDHDRVLEVVRKTARKMSAAALTLVGELPLETEASTLLADALAPQDEAPGED